jgi:arsenate reductase-like glutaredoxin family protein
VEIGEQVDARKSPIKGDAALGVLEGVDRLYATRGKRVVHVDLRKERPDRDTLRELLLGPTGNLRAPVVRKGRTLVVGFDEATYRGVLG